MISVVDKKQCMQDTAQIAVRHTNDSLEIDWVLILVENSARPHSEFGHTPVPHSTRDNRRGLGVDHVVCSVDTDVLDVRVAFNPFAPD